MVVDVVVADDVATIDVAEVDDDVTSFVASGSIARRFFFAPFEASTGASSPGAAA